MSFGTSVVFFLAVASLGGRLAGASSLGLCIARDAALSIGNLEITRGEVLKDLASTLNSLRSELNPNENWPYITNKADAILEHALYNTIQHGSSPQWTPTRVTTHVYSDDSDVYVTVSSPQHKRFPPALLQEFSVGQRVEVPLDQRAGYRGEGNGHGYIFQALRSLPPGSSVKWDADGKVVQFTLKIHYR